jgi:hypothetical protein
MLRFTGVPLDADTASDAGTEIEVTLWDVFAD